MSLAVLDRPLIDFLHFGEPEKRPFSVSLISAVVFHALLFLLGGFAFVRPPQYGIDLGRGGMEVYLVAAPVQVIKGETRFEPTVNEIQEIKTDRGEMVFPVPAQSVDKAQKAGDRKQSALISKNWEKQGDGSSPVPGEDLITFYSSGGAWVENQPGHLKNPAPYYPQRAIELGQEGLVLLSVWVSAKGLPERFELQKSSGFSLLDKSALAAVKKWKFSPGQTGFLVHDASVTIPIRFRLENAENF
mgnify:CR=1 FL=1